MGSVEWSMDSELLLHVVRSLYSIDNQHNLRKTSDVYFCHYMLRGTSNTQDAVAFRPWFFKLSELRSLVPDNIPFTAVTATATRRTKLRRQLYLFFG